MNLYAVILAGGCGTRFWPQSRTTLPKQLLTLQGEGSLLQNTVKRIASLIPSDRVLVVTAAHLQPQTLAQLPGLPPTNVLSEPVGRNTAAAVGLAAAFLVPDDPEAIMVVLPADHVIPDHAAFRTSVQQAVETVRHHDMLMTIGLRPTYPATGYGYIKVGAALANSAVPPACRAAQFIEKPPTDVATRLVASGQYYWNCGIFIWRAATILAEIRTYLPALWHGLQTYVTAIRTGANAEVLHQHYAALDNISIDYAILERSARVGVLPVTWAWSDVGSWRNLADLHPPDPHDNVVVGHHLIHDSTGLVIYSPDKLVATIGLTDLIIVQTDDTVLVCPKDRDQEVRDLVKALQQRGQTKHL
ncbi:Mannose-1-phosphate guanylyltransferase RfbM [Candidatus Entotheonellaceae bacterium PAL068K]